MRFAGSVTLRPVRLGFLVPPDNFGTIRRVIQLCTCLWGGRYNPIIPFVAGEHPPQYFSPYRNSNGAEITRGYIDFFEPDVIVEAAPGMAASLGWRSKERHFGLPRTIPLKDFYRVDSYGRVEFAAGIDIINVIQHLYDMEYKYQLRHRIPYASVQADQDDAFFDLFPGIYPNDPDLAHIVDAYQIAFEPDVLPPTAETSVKLIQHDYAGPLWITRYGLEEGLGSGHSDEVFFVFDHKNPYDVSEYWNYRLIHRRILPISIQWLAEHVELVREVIRQEYRPIPGNPSGLMFRSGIIFGRSISDEIATNVLEEHFADLPKGSFYKGRSPEIWPLARSKDRWRTTRILVSAKKESFDVDVTANGYAKVPELAPEFHDATRSYSEALWINVIRPTSSLWDNSNANVYPSDIWDPGEPARTINHQMIITREGWVVPQEYGIGYTLLRPITGREAFIKWFKRNGIETSPSEEGQVAAQIIDAAGSLLGCGLFADRETLELLNEMAESHLTLTRDGKSLTATGPDRAQHFRRIQQHFDKREKRTFGYWNKFDFALERSVFRAGLRVQCPICTYYNWFDLDTLAYVLTCNRCLKSFNFDQSPNALSRAEWFYRVIGPFAAPNYARGGYAVALTLRCLSESRRNELTWSTGLVLKNLKREIDFVAWYRRGSLGDDEQEEPALLIGEAKSFGKNAITDDDIAGLRAVAELFPEAFLVVSSLRTIDTYSKDEIKRLSDLAHWGRTRSNGWRPRNPLILLTATELFSEEGIEYTWKKLGGRAAELVKRPAVDLSDLYQLAEATQRLYLNLPPFYEDYFARLKAERRRLVQLIRMGRVRSNKS